jgi:hypothetical protein
LTTARFHAAKAREIRAEYEAGTAFADLVRKHGGTEYSIKRAIKSAGGSLVPVTPPLSEQDRKTILGLAKDGLSQMKISLQLGRSQSTVRRFLASQGIAHRKAKGAAHGRWKGGRIIAGGYARVLVAHDDPMASMRFSDGYVPEHRLVMARALGRPLLRTETVHHINGDKTAATAGRRTSAQRRSRIRSVRADRVPCESGDVQLVRRASAKLFPHLPQPTDERCRNVDAHGAHANARTSRSRRAHGRIAG